MFKNIFLPHPKLGPIPDNLSFIRIMPEHSLATFVAEFPGATPI